MDVGEDLAKSRDLVASEVPDGAVSSRSVLRRRQSKRRMVVAIVILVGALGFILAKGLGSSLNYFDTISQAESHRQSLGTTSFRLEGTVEKGSIDRTAKGATFMMIGGNYPIKVVNVGSPPALFQPGIPVVVEGHFLSSTSTTFDSNQILVKHSATYIAKHPTRVKPKSSQKK